MEHTEWLASVTDRDSARTIAKRSGVPGRTVLNQMEKGRLSAENVIRIADGYGQSPVRALVDTGFIDEQWAETVDPITALRQVSEEDLADEVLRRMKLPGAHEVLDTPVDELDARRGEKSNDQVPPAKTPSPPPEHDGTVREFDLQPGTYAADSSTNEGKAREERGEDPID